MDGPIVERIFDEIREDHAVAAGLAWADGVEETDDDDRYLFLLPIGEGEKFVEGFGGGVAPSAFGGGAEDEVGVFVERDVGIFAVDFGCGSDEDALAFFAGGFENHLGAVDVRFDGADGAFDDELDAHGGGEMDDDVGVVHELGDQLAIFDVVEVIFHLAGSFQVADVVHASGGEIVEQDDAIAAGEETFRQMRTDETSAAGD